MKSLRLVLSNFLAFAFISSFAIAVTPLCANASNLGAATGLSDYTSSLSESTGVNSTSKDGNTWITGDNDLMRRNGTGCPSGVVESDKCVDNATTLAVGAPAVGTFTVEAGNFHEEKTELFDPPLGQIVDCDDGDEYFSRSGYSIVFTGYSHDSINCRTCFYYCVQNNDETPNINHYLFGYDECDETCLDEMYIEEDIGVWVYNNGHILRNPGAGGPYFTGYDPATDFCGVRVDRSLDEGDVDKVFICVDGLHGIGWIKGVFKTETYEYIDIPGPEVCEGVCAPGGNPNACGFCEIVNGPEEPVCPDAVNSYDAQITGVCGNPVYTWTVTGDHAGYTANGSSITVTAGSNCGGAYTVSVSIACEDCSPGPLTCHQFVQIGEAEAPSIICPIDIAIECDQSISPEITGYPTVIDNCIDPVTNIAHQDFISPGNCANNYSIERIWTATDACGNQSQCAQNITVEDTTPPAIACPADVSLDCEQDTSPSVTGIATALDNCTDTVSDIGHQDNISPGNCPNNYTIERTWTATDACGNESQCTQTITVEDTTPPALTIIDPRIAPIGDTTFMQCYGQDPAWALPKFDENSVAATDDCSPDVTVEYSGELVNEGNCLEDGYIFLYRLTWTATDECGNSSSISAMLALIDNVAPVIFGVPEDITVNCDEIPDPPALVYATDECLCACVVMLEETPIQSACQDGQAIIRTWTANDDCGNTTVASQRITLVNNTSPQFVVLQPELKGLPDGAVISYTCNYDKYRNLFYRLSAQSVSTPEFCGDAPIVNFSLTNSIDPDNCEFNGYKEQLTAQWTAVDACGNESSLTFYARLIDSEAPLLFGVPEMTCMGDPALQDIYATDNCGVAFTHFWDTSIPNPCGNGDATLRTYEAYDDCGNSSTDTVILIPNENNPPIMEFVNPLLIGLESGDVIELECNNRNGGYTAFGAEDIIPVDACSEGVMTVFAEKLIESRDCTTGKMVAIIELQWTSTDMCGNSGVHSLEAHIFDNSGPEFTGFQPTVNIGCLDSLPVYTTTDYCSDFTVSVKDSIVSKECELEYVIHRVVTATDYCGNVTTKLQTINVGDGKGPIIEGVEEGVCDDLAMPNVTAFDDCTGEFVPVTMKQDTVDVNCQSGMVIARTWSAVGVCGNITSVRQTINMDDKTPPEIQIPWHSVIKNFEGSGMHLVNSSDVETLFLLSILNENSVVVTDECGEQIIPKYTIEVFPGDCVADGFSERRVYTWVARDICGNATTFSFAVHIIDDIPPAIDSIPTDMVVACVSLQPAGNIPVDERAGETMVYNQIIVRGENPGEYKVTRTWVATDACGNERKVIQNITWIPENTMECEVLGPDIVNCNSHGVVVDSDITGGNGPYTYRWELQGEKCFIQSGQGTPQITIYVGWTKVKIILYVTDVYGCVSMCMYILDCEFGMWQVNTSGTTSDAFVQLKESGIELRPDGNKPVNLTELNYWPNPTDGNVNLSFESAVDHEVHIAFTNLLGQVVKYEQFDANLGFNIHKTNIDYLEPGSYLMQVTTAEERHTKVIVIARQ